MAIYKIGDDLRQDQLTLQTIRIIDKLWLKEGLDMRIVTYACVPTSADKEGVMEMVRPAETLREIQVYPLAHCYSSLAISQVVAICAKFEVQS